MPFASKLPICSKRLPLTLISLDDWIVIAVSGPDAEKYLQGQLTLDITTLKSNNLYQAAHCDPKGKVWSNIQLFKIGQDFFYIIRRSVYETQVAELKKYAVFSKLSITTFPEKLLIGIAGQDAKKFITEHFPHFPDADTQVLQHNGSTLLYITQPEPRFIVIADQPIIAQLTQSVALNNSAQWLALDIEAGIPIIDQATTDEFLPQALNLHALNAINFNKGCYSGQEMVARAKYRGANKRALYWLAGNSQTIPNVGEELELKLGENWRRTGTVLASVKLEDNTLYVQAILNKDITTDDILRVTNDQTSELKIQTLPYIIEK